MVDIIHVRFTWMISTMCCPLFATPGPSSTSSLIAFAEVGTWSRLEFPELRSLAVLCHDNMVPLLQLMIMIPALDSLTLRDFTVYPSTISTNPAVELMDVDDLITQT